MKIINRKEFLELPEGILYSKYKQCTFEGLYIKGESLPSHSEDWLGDYGQMNLIGNIEAHDGGDHTDKLIDAEENKTSLKLYFGADRDGYFDQEQLFAVYEEEDIKELLHELKAAIPYKKANAIHL